MDVLRIVLVEDESLFRDLLKIALERHPRLEIVGVFSNAPTALSEIPNLAPDIVLLDIDLGGDISGVELGVILRQALPKLGVVLLSNHQDIEFVASLGSKTLTGWSYLLKKSVRNAEVLLRAIEGAHDGLTVLDPQLLGGSVSSTIAHLPQRQREILRFLAQGYSNAAIGQQLELSAKTVENNINSLYTSLGIKTQNSEVHPRVSAVLIYLESLRGA